MGLGVCHYNLSAASLQSLQHKRAALKTGLHNRHIIVDYAIFTAARENLHRLCSADL
ncbi:MAG: hypothetical protein IJ910_04965 [Bacteroidaceae bacterium]|nr:hypothetical protein [Bacteroidaceae bacterium]